MNGSCKSLIELENFLEEVYKATTDQLDWINPEGQQYTHDLRKPLPLIPNSRGRQVIPFDHFINNDLEYLSGGGSSKKYTTSVTKTKAANYRHIKWIEDLVPNRMWNQVPISYDKHALWGISYWGQKRQQFYGFAVNRESDRDVYSKHRIIVVTNLQIVEWNNYKHLDWITVHRDDDKNKDKKNRLMLIGELHKFSDGTLNDVQTALDDHIKGIRMKYSNPIASRPKPGLENPTQGYPLDSVEFLSELVLGFKVSPLDIRDVCFETHWILKDGGEVKEFQRSFRHSDIERLSRSDKVLKLKNFKKDATLNLFMSTNQERYSRSHLKQAKEQAQDLKSMITTSNHKIND
ncbi:hypothetical protein Tco_1104970 [Tanacetum coccineum]